jgi:hypothetical protein
MADVYLIMARLSLFYLIFYRSVFVNLPNICTTDGADVCLQLHQYVVLSYCTTW